MVTNVVMPKLSLTMKEGTVGKWYKKEGDHVEKDEPIVEVVSEKATYDLEAPASGTLQKILVQEGVDVPVNGVLAVIVGLGEILSTKEAYQSTFETSSEEETRILASPAAKRLAREQSVDLSLIRGSGPEGRITEQDVRLFIERASAASPEIKEIVRLTGFRKISAERVSTSFRTAPHSTITMEIDASSFMALHERLQVSYTAILVKAVAEALAEHPMINSTIDGDQIRIFSEINIGVAVATKNGLVVPVVHGANMKTLQEIDEAIRTLTQKAEQEKLTRDDVSRGTFTITNLGMYRVDSFNPIINPPEAAILGVGVIKEKPVVIEKRIDIKPLMMLSLSYDHRIVDGAPAAEFLLRVKDEIERKSEVEG
jgi:pyruvate dehydrogenase E2 component (dihydrolipoamide acetyltransferase)